LRGARCLPEQSHELVLSSAMRGASSVRYPDPPLPCQN
jgi:hypothetical protein